MALGIGVIISTHLVILMQIFYRPDEKHSLSFLSMQIMRLQALHYLLFNRSLMSEKHNIT